MSSAGGEPVDYSRITGPSTPPPDEADPLTAKALKQSKQGAHKPTPSDRLDASVARHISALEIDCGRLREVNVDLNSQLVALHRGAAGTESELATLRQQLHDTRATFGFSALAQAFGGTLVSGAGTTGDLFWKPLLLWSGVASFLIGLLLGAWAIMFVGRGRPRRAEQGHEIAEGT